MQFEFAQTTGLKSVFGIQTGSYASISGYIRSISDIFSRRVWLWGSAHVHPFRLIFAALVISFQGASGYGCQRPPRTLKSEYPMGNNHDDFTTIYMQPEIAQKTGLKMVFGHKTGSYASVWAHILPRGNHFSRRVRWWV